MVGVGFDVKLTHHIALRPLEADYLITHFDNPFPNTAHRGWQSNVRLSSGIVFRFGGEKPAPPPDQSPVASCSVDRSMVYTRSGDFVVVTANASDPDNDPLTYTWTTSGGAVEGNGSGRDDGILPEWPRDPTPCLCAWMMGAAAPRAALRISLWRCGPIASRRSAVLRTALRSWPENRRRSPRLQAIPMTIH